MSKQIYRLPQGGRIDRARTLRFSFGGRSLDGHPGDTLASALLANGQHMVARSFKYHRPRGILGAGGEDPAAIVQLGSGARGDPNTRVTEQELFDGLAARPQNCWPTLGLDVGAGADLLCAASFRRASTTRPSKAVPAAGCCSSRSSAALPASAARPFPTTPTAMRP